MQGLFPGGLGASLARFKELTISARSAGMAPESGPGRGPRVRGVRPPPCAVGTCWPRGRRGRLAGPGVVSQRPSRSNPPQSTWPAIWTRCSGGKKGAIFVGYDLTRSLQLQGIGAMGLILAPVAPWLNRGLSHRVAERHLRPGGPMWGPYGFSAAPLPPGASSMATSSGMATRCGAPTTYWAYLGGGPAWLVARGPSPA